MYKQVMLLKALSQLDIILIQRLWDIISRWISDDEYGENFSTCIMEILDEWIHPVFIKYFWFLLGFSTNFMGIIFLEAVL